MPAASWIQQAWRSSRRCIGVGVLGIGGATIGLSTSADGQGVYSMQPSAYSAPVLYGGYRVAPMQGATPVYGYYQYPYGHPSASGWVQPAAYAPHGGQYQYPCPPSSVGASIGDGMSPETVGDDENASSDDVDLPEVADLTSDAALASFDQSSTPNMIGDTIGFGGTGVLVITDGISGDALSVSPGAGRKYKASTNNSPLPQTRIYYNFHYFDNALTAISDTSMWGIDVKRQEFGAEYAFFGNLASVQVTVPVSWTIDSTLVQPTGVIPTPHDTELGNISIALKGVLYQNCCTTLSVGLGVDLPTADDIYVDNGLTTFELTNETVTLSPFVGLLWQPTCNTFFQSFVQTSLPLGENGVEIGDVFDADIAELKLLYVDASLGTWLYRDACGNGVAALGEIHFSRTIGDDEGLFYDDGFVETSFFEDHWKALHATAGFAAVYNCWSVSPAVVLPLLDDPDRFFDWEATIQVNRRF
jgi:hypothetical protein